MADTSLVDLFLRPASLAIIGASEDPLKIGGRPLRYCIEAGYPGEIYPINPRHAVVQGLPAFASIRDVPATPALAIIAVARNAVLAAVEDCVAAGVGALIIFSAGFAELDDEGQRLQEAVLSCTRAAGVRIIGPNANGVFSTEDGLFALFSPVLDRGRPEPGRTAVVTQSAAVGTSLLDLMRREGFGVRYWLHVGNEADVSLVDLARDLVADDGVDTIVLAFESLRRADRLADFLNAAAKHDTRVIAFQTGFSAVARAAAASHTGALTVTNPALVRDILIQSGAVVATTFRETVSALAPRMSRSGGQPVRVAVLTSSGGFGVLTADVLAETGAQMPRLSDGLQQALLGIAPYCHPANPVDSTAQIINDRGAYGRIGTAVARSGEVDVLVTFLPHPDLDDSLTLELIELAGSSLDGGCVFVAIGPADGATALLLRRHGIWVGSEPADLTDFLPAPDMPANDPLRQSTIATNLDATETKFHAKNGIVPELDAKRVLIGLGLSVVTDAEIHTVEEAVAAASVFSDPVALKLNAPGIAHKASLGGVRLGLSTETEVREAATEILALQLPEGSQGHSSLLLEPMVEGVEAFVGVSRTPDFGTVVVLGLGGTDVETAAHVGYATPPVDATDVRRLVERSGLLAQIGLRQRDVIEAQILTICRALTDWFVHGSNPPIAVDINPLMIRADGDCLVIDALIEVDPEHPESDQTEGRAS
jgi:acyl-CoA synthetase (NDP forming)